MKEGVGLVWVNSRKLVILSVVILIAIEHIHLHWHVLVGILIFLTKEVCLVVCVLIVLILAKEVCLVLIVLGKSFASLIAVIVISKDIIARLNYVSIIGRK